MINRKDVMHSVRYWDKAASEKAEASFTAGVLMHRMRDGMFVIEHVARGQWNARDRELKIKTLAQIDSKMCNSYEVVIEQEHRQWGKGKCREFNSQPRRLSSIR